MKSEKRRKMVLIEKKFDKNLQFFIKFEENSEILILLYYFYKYFIKILLFAGFSHFILKRRNPETLSLTQKHVFIFCLLICSIYEKIINLMFFI